MNNYLRPVFKIHGGKRYLAEWLISLFPKNYQKMTYVEPFIGAGSVLLNKEPSEREVINDLDPNVVAIFRALQEKPTRFINKLAKLSYAEETFEQAKHGFTDPAVTEYVLRRMSRGGLKTDFGWSERLRGGKPGDVNAWETMLDHLPLIAERLKKVIIHRTDAVALIMQINSPRTFLYLDPPYVPESRVTKQAYDYEFEVKDHVELALALKKFQGPWMLSGYESELYNTLYGKYKCHKKDIVNHASQGKKKEIKTECVWRNY